MAQSPLLESPGGETDNVGECFGLSSLQSSDVAAHNRTNCHHCYDRYGSPIVPLVHDRLPRSLLDSRPVILFQSLLAANKSLIKITGAIILAVSFARQWAVLMRHHGLRQWGRAMHLPAWEAMMGLGIVSPNFASVGEAADPPPPSDPITTNYIDRKTWPSKSRWFGASCRLYRLVLLSASYCGPSPSSSTANRMYSSKQSQYGIMHGCYIVSHHRPATPARTARCHSWLPRQWRSIWMMVWSQCSAQSSPSTDARAGAGAIRPQARWGPRGHRKDPLRWANVSVAPHGSNEEAQRQTPHNCGSIASE